MGQEPVGNYQRLANLLRSQKEALEKDDPGRLAALLPLIGEYSKRVASGKHPEEHPPQAAPLIHEIVQLAAENQRAYRRRKASLNEMQAQIQSASRYLQQVRHNQPSSPARATWTG